MIELVSRSRDSGETLIELLVAVVVLGIASTGLIAGLSSGVFATDSHRRISVAESTVRGFGELIKDKVIHPTSTSLTSDVAAFSSGDNLTLPVTSTSAFTDSGQYTISAGGSIFKVKGQTATTFSVTALSGGALASGTTVQRYESCPDTTYWDDVLTSHPELTTGTASDVTKVTGVTWYYPDPAHPGTWLTLDQTGCGNYHGANYQTSCKNSNDWRTECDPPWMRVTLSIARTNSGRSAAETSTDVIIRRLP